MAASWLVSNMSESGKPLFRHDESVGEALVLWDIDGTLVSCGPPGRKALEAGAGAAMGTGTVPHVHMNGKTDPQILGEIMALAGLEPRVTQELIPVALRRAEEMLVELLPEMRTVGFVHPGVPCLLKELAEKDIRQTLVTGNAKANAALKVSTFGLDGFLDLPVGAYGTDHADRNCLVPIALERVSGLREESYDPNRVWVIGDTPHDLNCARAAGVRCLLVGTGRDGYDSVRDLDADVIVPDLSATQEIIDVML